MITLVCISSLHMHMGIHFQKSSMVLNLMLPITMHVHARPP